MTTKPIEIIQGDNFEGYDFNLETGEAFDGTWNATWAVAQSLGKEPLLHFPLDKSLDGKKYMFRMTPAQTASLPVGSYVLIIELSNESLEYNKEIVQEPLKILKQGIPNA